MAGPSAATPGILWHRPPSPWRPWTAVTFLTPGGRFAPKRRETPLRGVGAGRQNVTEKILQVAKWPKSRNLDSPIFSAGEVLPTAREPLGVSPLVSPACRTTDRPLALEQGTTVPPNRRNAAEDDSCIVSAEIVRQTPAYAGSAARLHRRSAEAHGQTWAGIRLRAPHKPAHGHSRRHREGL